MARSTRIGRGGLSVTMSPGLQELADRLRSSRTYRRIAERMEEEACELTESARARWPVGDPRGGHSRDALQTTVRLQPRIEAVTEIDPRSRAVTYAADIESAQVGRGRPANAYQVLIVRPGRARGRALARALARILADAARGR